MSVRRPSVRAMRELVTSTPASGRIEGSPPGVAVGTGVLAADVARVDAATASHLRRSEGTLAVARLRGTASDWQFYVAMFEHRFARVAIGPEGASAVLQVEYADVRASSWAPVTFTTAKRHLVFGELAFASDAALLEAAMWNLTLPVESSAARRPSL